MTKIYKIILLSILVISLVSISGIIYLVKSQPKVAYIKVGYLYDNFDYKKELESKLTNMVQMRKTIIDSLGLHLDQLSQSIERDKEKDKTKISEFNEEKQKYLMKKQEFDEDNQDVTKRYSDETMKQLNQYVQDFGKTNGYTYILGAEGAGAIMSADEKYDITSQVLDYVNDRYKGKK